MHKFNFTQFDHSCIPSQPIGVEPHNAVASRHCVTPQTNFTLGCFRGYARAYHDLLHLFYFRTRPSLPEWLRSIPHIPFNL